MRKNSLSLCLCHVCIYVAGAAGSQAAESWSKGFFGPELWAFNGSVGWKYQGSPACGDPPVIPTPIPPEWDQGGGPGSIVSFRYSGTGALPPPVDFTILLGEKLVMGDYHLFIHHFYVGRQDVIVGTQTFSDFPFVRFGWNAAFTVSINTATDETDRIILRLYPTMIEGNNVYQEQNYIIQGLYITSDFGAVVQGYNRIVKLLPSTPPVPLGLGVNYLEDGSFECGLGHGWGQAMGNRSYPITDNVDSATSAEGSRSVRFDLQLTGDGVHYSFPLESKFYRLSPYVGGNTQNPKLTYTLSCWMKGSRTAGSIGLGLVGIGTDLAGEQITLSSNVPLTTSWQRFFITGTLADFPAYLYGVRFLSNESAPITVWVDGVQLEEGSAASAYKNRTAVEVGFLPTQPGNIYYDNAAQAPVTLQFDNPGLLSGTTINYECFNYYDQLVAKGSQNIDLGSMRNSSQNFNLYCAKRGVFRTLVWANGASTKAEFVYSVIPPNPHLNEDFDLGTLACDTHFDPLGLSILKRANYNSVISKMYARWYMVEPTQDNFVWQDQAMINARSAKMRILLQFGNPDWGRQAFVQANVTTGYPISNWDPVLRSGYLADWNDFVRNTVNRYKPWVKEWEIENEPNSGFQPQDYGEILKQSYATIKSADPQALVCGFSGGGYSQNWYDTIYNYLGSTNYFDKVSVHLYTGVDAGIFDGFKTWMSGHGNKPSLNTETGSTCNHMFTTLPTYNSVTYATDHLDVMRGNWEQTKNTLRNYLFSVSVGGMQRYYWYFNRFTNCGPTQPTRRGGNAKDTTEFDGSQRCNGVALSVASAAFVDGNIYNGTCNGFGFSAYLWATPAGGTTGWLEVPNGVLSLPTLGSLTFYDMMGNSLQAEGATQIRPGSAPLLLSSPLGPSTVRNELTSLVVNTAATNAIPLAFMSGAPSGTISGGAVYSLFLTGRDQDEDGQSITGVELTLNGSPVVPAPAGIGPYALTVPTASGSYALSFRVKDNEGSWSNPITSNFNVGSSSNQAPVITSLPWANPNPVTLPNKTTVNVSAYDPDTGPAALTYTWSQVSGPGTTNFSPNGTTGSDSSAASFTTAGSYVLRVTVFDGAASVTGDLAVSVNPLPNQSPVISAGLSANPNSVILPGTSTVSVLAYDPDNGPSPLIYTWSTLSGPGNANFSPNGTTGSASSSASFPAAGSYTLRVTVSDGAATVTGDVNVSVNSAPATSMHVLRIDMSLASNPGGTKANARVYVVDANGAPVSGASVSGTWSGLASGSSSGTTGTDGGITLSSTKTKKSGTFTFTIANVMKSGFVYQPAQNGETSDSISR